MKGTPSRPQCGFSNMVCRILDGHGAPVRGSIISTRPDSARAGVAYASRNVLEDPQLREGIKMFTAWPTIPQVFIGGEFVGGADIMMSMNTSGELAKTVRASLLPASRILTLGRRAPSSARQGHEAGGQVETCNPVDRVIGVRQAR